MKCPNCSKETVPGALFCAACGARVVMPSNAPLDAVPPAAAFTPPPNAPEDAPQPPDAFQPHNMPLDALQPPKAREPQAAPQDAVPPGEKKGKKDLRTPLFVALAVLVLCGGALTVYRAVTGQWLWERFSQTDTSLEGQNAGKKTKNRQADGSAALDGEASEPEATAGSPTDESGQTADTGQTTETAADEISASEEPAAEPSSQTVTEPTAAPPTQPSTTVRQTQPTSPTERPTTSAPEPTTTTPRIEPPTERPTEPEPEPSIAPEPSSEPPASEPTQTAVEKYVSGLGQTQYDTLRSNQYTFEAKSKEGSEVTKVKLSRSGKKIYAVTDVNGFEIGLYYNGSDTWFYYPKKKIYALVDDKDLAMLEMDRQDVILNLDDMGLDDLPPLKEAQSMADTTVNGVSCKLFRLARQSNGESVNVYLNGKKLIRLEYLNASGKVTSTMDVVSVSADFPQLPPGGYKQVSLMELMLKTALDMG